ncbi:hypothetical protein DV737_g4334, partial [Chaetothyriales sp. CBS 132003]
MFSSAFKSYSSNISSNYDVSKQPSATAGPWTIFDAKKRSTGAQVSVFVLKRETLDQANGQLGARASATSIRKMQDVVVDRLKKEASILARLRHPSILQLVEPVEETRGGGLIFATEPVQCSLAGALVQQDRSSSSLNGHESSSRAVRDIQLDELELQKGFLQVAKGLEFLHDSAKLVHANLTPDAIFINAKSDWKISGFGFAGSPDNLDASQANPHIALSEVLQHDPRVPRFVQLDLDYTSPDFVLDSNVTSAADMFSLGLVLLACYRTPHRSPIDAHGSQSTYKKICSSVSTVPNPSNNYLSGNSLPQELAQTLARVLARRPAQRMSASEFQQSQYFDNVLVNTMRFLDDLPAKSAVEKSQFMRGLGRILPQFPKSVLSKKVLSALLDELKDRELLAPILQNAFAIVKLVLDGKEIMTDKILPRLRETFLSKAKSEETDKSKEAGLLVVLENIRLVADNCTAKQFKDDLLPIIHVAMESSTHSLTDAALHTVPVVLPLIDFSTVKHDLFPVVASVFAKTSSLSIKIRGLEALGVLCGGSGSATARDEFSGTSETDKAAKNLSSLDKFTMQEKVVPLLKAIKTKEPAVMMAALKVLRRVGHAADIDFAALELMPILWSFSLGPLLDATQFSAFMEVIKALSAKIEREHGRKLHELGPSRSSESRPSSSAHAPMRNGANAVSSSAGTEDDFAKLVLGNKAAIGSDPFAGALSDGQRLTQNPPSFSWQSAGPANVSPAAVGAVRSQTPSRSITPDVLASAFPSLQPAAPSSSIWAPTQPLPGQPQVRSPLSASLQPQTNASNFSTPASSTNVWQSPAASALQTTSSPGPTPILPPPPSGNTAANPWKQSTPPLNSADVSGSGIGASTAPSYAVPPPTGFQAQAHQQPKTGLDKYQSLL